MFKQIIHKVVYPAAASFLVMMDTFRDSRGAVANVILDKFSILETILLNLSINGTTKIKRFVASSVLTLTQKLISNVNIKKFLLYVVVAMSIAISHIIFIKAMVITATVNIIRLLYASITINNIDIDANNMIVDTLTYLSLWDAFTTGDSYVDDMDTYTLAGLYTT